MTTIPFIGYNFYTMFFIFLFWSFIGWMIEIVDMTYETGEFQNRGFLNMPICPIYGVGVLMILIFFRPFKDTYWQLALISLVLCSAFEYFMGWIMEKAFHTRWWDYSHMKFNLHGYVCLRNALFFGVGCMVMYHWLEPAVETMISKIPVRVGWGIIAVMSLLIIIDTISSIMAAKKLQSRIRRLDEISAMMLTVSEKTGMKLADGTLKVKSGVDKAKESAGNAYEKIKDINSDNIERLRTEYEKLIAGDAPTNRLIRAFPRLISRRYRKGLRIIRKHLKIYAYSPSFLKTLRQRNKDFRPDEDLLLPVDKPETELVEVEMPAAENTEELQNVQNV